MLRKKRLIVLAAGAVLLGLLSLPLAAASGGGQGQEKLGGAWLGVKSDGGHRWTCVQTPLDSAAKEAALQIKFIVYSSVMAGLIGSKGADSFTPFVGAARMIGRTTAQFTQVGYAMKQSQLGLPPEIKLIFVAFGTFEFTDSEHAVLKYTVNVYPAATDVNGDGMPDPGSAPWLAFPITDYAQRVPILP
jgi:hypothetical protein